MVAPIQLSRKKAAKDSYLRWRRLNEFLLLNEVTALTPVQRIASVAYAYETDVLQMGGHHGLCSTSQVDITEVVSALEAIGAKEQASILSRNDSVEHA